MVCVDASLAVKVVVTEEGSDKADGWKTTDPGHLSQREGRNLLMVLIALKALYDETVQLLCCQRNSPVFSGCQHWHVPPDLHE